MWLQRKCKEGINPPRSQNQPSLLKSKILTSKLVSWEHQEAIHDLRGADQQTLQLTSASTIQHPPPGFVVIVEYDEVQRHAKFYVCIFIISSH